MKRTDIVTEKPLLFKVKQAANTHKRWINPTTISTILEVSFDYYTFTFVTGQIMDLRASENEELFRYLDLNRKEVL